MTATKEVLNPFAAAVEAAKAETAGEPAVATPETPTQVEGTEAAGDDHQAVTPDSDQANVEGPLEDGSAEDTDPFAETEPAPQGDEQAPANDEVFADFEIEEPAAPSPEEQLYQLPGIDEPVSFDQLKDGYLRQADYTRKTQELAAQRQAHEKAISFWDTFTQHPKEVVLQLAKEAGLDVGDATVAKMVDMPFASEADIQARVDQEVERRLQDDPRVLQAEQIETERWLTDSFSEIEKTLSIKLGPESRRKVILRAYNAGTDDLMMVTQAMLAEVETKKARTQQLAKASPQRPSGAPNVESNTEPAGSFNEAVEMAKAEIASRSRRR